jgi:hypothetical protein
MLAYRDVMTKISSQLKQLQNQHKVWYNNQPVVHGTNDVIENVGKNTNASRPGTVLIAPSNETINNTISTEENSREHRKIDADLQKHDVDYDSDDNDYSDESDDNDDNDISTIITVTTAVALSSPTGGRGNKNKGKRFGMHQIDQKGAVESCLVFTDLVQGKSFLSQIEKVL